MLATSSPNRPSAEEIAAAVPLRTEVRSSVLRQQTLFTEQTPIYYQAGLTYWQLRPMTNFLNSEIAWWNANIELTTQQVTTRKISYTESYALLQKELQENIKTAIKSLDTTTAQKIVDQLNGTSIKTESGSGSGSGSGSKSDYSIGSIFGSTSGSESKTSSGSIFGSMFAPSVSGFVDISGSKPIPNASNTVPLPKAPIDTTDLQQTVNSMQSTAAANTNLSELNKTTATSIYDGAIAGSQFLILIIYLLIALRFAGFTTSELLYKPLSYRILAFFYTIIFTPILFPYFIYREIRYAIWPDVLAPRFESIFPIVPYDPKEPLTINHRLYGYADTAEINTWMSKMRDAENENRTKILNTNILQSLRGA
jgi:hypothetical protein